MIEPMRNLLVEKLQSQAQQQSSEQYLVPRNCWIQISKISIKQQTFEKNQKLRVKISVPNSGRVLKSSQIQIDDQFLSLFENKPSNSFSDIPVDLIAVCEYLHDVRIGHSSNLEIELELTSSILSRTKCLGIAAIDLAHVIQKPHHIVLSLTKDNVATSSIDVQLHSLSLSNMHPKFPISPSASLLSDSDSEPIPSITPQISSQISQVLSTLSVLVIDATSPQGQILKRSVGLSDSALSITEYQVIQHTFEVASQQISNLSGLRFIIGGTNYFISRFLVAFLIMRDRGIFSTDSFSFVILPLKSEQSKIVESFISNAVHYAESFLDPSWLSIFDEDSAVQNAAALISPRISFLQTCELSAVTMPVGDVLLTTENSQSVVPMLLDLVIGDEARFLSQMHKSTGNVSQMKGVFFGKKTKNIPIKFHHFECVIREGALYSKWREITNSNILPMIPSLDKYAVEETRRQSSKISLKLHKGQPPIDVRIDGVLFRRIVELTITIREPEASLLLSFPK